jgi:hypothetical protein
MNSIESLVLVSSSVNSWLAVFACVSFVLLCAVGGYFFAEKRWHVEPRNNGSHVLGGVLGLLVLIAIAGFFESFAWGVVGTLVTLGFLSFAVRLQLG